MAEIIVKNNDNKESLVSLRCEMAALAGLIHHPDALFSIEDIITSDTFSEKANSALFSILQKEIENSRKPDQVALAEYLKNIGITHFNEIPVYDYLSSLCFCKTTLAGTIENFKILAKLKILRLIDFDCIDIRKLLRNKKSEDISKIVAEIDAKHSNRIQSISLKEDNFKDIFEDICPVIEEIAKNPKEEVGFLTPFPLFNKLYGGTRIGNGFYSITSRAGIGKSSFLLALAKGSLILNPNLKVLFFDTELDEKENIFRLASSETGIPHWYLASGNWILKDDFKKRYKDNLHNFDKLKGRLFHCRVPNKDVNDIIFLIKKWYYKFVGRNGDALVVYDYVKTTGEKITKNYSEYQLIGDKLIRLNEIGAELNIGLWLAIQANREAELGTEDSSVVGLSDRLQWFCAYNGLLKRKSLEEISESGTEWGTHKIITLKSRFGGKENQGHFPYINCSTDPKKKKYVNNYINYKIDNFKVSEVGDLNSIMDSRKEKYSLDK